MPRRPPNRKPAPLEPFRPPFESTLSPEDRAERALFAAPYRISTALRMPALFVVGATDHGRRVAMLRRAIVAGRLEGATIKGADGRMRTVAEEFERSLDEPLILGGDTNG